MIQYNFRKMHQAIICPLIGCFAMGSLAFANPYWNGSVSSTQPNMAGVVGNSQPQVGRIVSQPVSSDQGSDGSDASLTTDQGPTMGGSGNLSPSDLYASAEQSLKAVTASFGSYTSGFDGKTVNSKGWGDYFTLQQNLLLGNGTNSLDLLWTGMDYQALNQLPTLSPVNVSAPILPEMTATVNPNRYDPSGTQVSSMVSVIKNRIRNAYLATSSGSTTGDTSGSSGVSEMQVLHDAVYAPFQNPAQGSANPGSGSGASNTGWLAQINTASSPQLLRVIALELAVSNQLQYQQLKVAQMNAAANAQILAEQYVLEHRIDELSKSMDANTNTVASIMIRQIQLKQEAQHG